MPFDGGPYLKAAVFVNVAIQGNDNVLSLIRVIDRLVTQAQGASPPKEMPVVTSRMNAVIMLVSGKARGRHEVRLVREAPNGVRKDVWTGGILLEGENKGHNINLEMNETFDLEGTYWYDVLVENELMTRMPFQVLYQPMTTRATGRS
jgi:hypothetical protein